MKVAVIGAGIAGMGAAWALAKRGIKVSLYEQNSEIGGDAYTVPVYAWDGTLHKVDGGVSDFNRSTFTNFVTLLQDLDVTPRRIQRECGFMTPKQLPCYFITDQGKFSFRKNWRHAPAFEQEVQEFRDQVVQVLHDERLHPLSVGEYFKAFPRSQDFMRYFFYPRALACFAMHEGAVEDYPMRALVAFWNMHAIVGSHHSDRMCLPGGMHSYLERFTKWLQQHQGEIRLNTRAASVRGGQDSVEIVTQPLQGEVHIQTFDAVVIAIKPNHMADLILDKTPELNTILAALPFRRDRVVVHTDVKLLPRSKRSWGAFNLTIPNSMDQVMGRTTITFWVNRLSVLDKRLPDIFITLNPPMEPDPVRIIEDRVMIHPVATFAGMEAVARLKELQGKQRVWYAGSFLEIPFLHENAFNTGIAAAEDILLRFS